MKVLYDHQIFNHQVYGGISRYFFELMNQFAKSSDVDFELSLKYSDNHYLESADFADYESFCGGLRFRGRNRIMNFLNEKQSRKSLIKQDFDVFHPTYFSTYFLDYIGNKPFVLTIYDMTHEVLSHNFLTKDQTVSNKKTLSQKAAKIIAISESTKRDIVTMYGIAEEKIKVVHLANSIDPTVSGEFDLPIDKYLLFVGSRTGYKNFQAFVAAVAPLLNQDKSLNVVCTGNMPFYKQEFDMFDKLSVTGQLFYFGVSDKQLAFLYKKAIAFVFPSLYEGFGIPILEAFACNCPVILSNRTSLPEVGGDAAEYFDPENVDEIRETIRKVITDKSKQEDMKQKGIIRLKLFSWEKTAKQTLDIYRSII